MISCVITTYKREPEVLKKAVDSILSQSYKDIEIIVVNDAPEDSELSNRLYKMLSEYDFPINYIVHESNKGACEARNTGIKNSNGEYIAFLDDDDEWEKEKLEKQLKKILSDHSALVYCDYYYIDKNGKMNIRKSDKQNLPGGNDFDRLL